MCGSATIGGQMKASSRLAAPKQNKRGERTLFPCREETGLHWWQIQCVLLLIQDSLKDMWVPFANDQLNMALNKLSSSSENRQDNWRRPCVSSGYSRARQRANSDLTPSKVLPSLLQAKGTYLPDEEAQPTGQLYPDA